MSFEMALFDINLQNCQKEISSSFGQRKFLVVRRVVILVHFHASSMFPNFEPLQIKFRRSFRLPQNLKELEIQFCD